ncbi:hypothetical protein SEA_PHERRYCRUZ_51 [Streptomyces phage PherryCruz]|nr:hypothetical protein SEA_PHERRYCRUZ_51 [Streptomyces phage PherryCruz]
MYYVIEQDGSIAFEGTPMDVENWLFENTPLHNARLRVRMNQSTITAWQYLGWTQNVKRSA